MDDIEIKMEVFKIIRANVDKKPKQIMRLIKEHLPDINQDKINAAVKDLMDSK